MLKIKRNQTVNVKIGDTNIGNNNPIVVQSMCATKTQDTDATINQVQQLQNAGAGVIRIAVDSKKDANALKNIRQNTTANLSVDLQENYRLVELVAPYVDKVRYNPGHLYHHEKKKKWQDKVRYIVDCSAKFDCAIRVGVNAGSVDPETLNKHTHDDSISPMLASAADHCELLDKLNFNQYCVSLKDSDPRKVITLNSRFAEQHPHIPLHLGVTEAGMPPDGIIKTRIAFEQLIGKGIGDTIRVSLTLANAQKHEEVLAGHQILDDINNGRVRSVVKFDENKLNIISCPSCSRVENEAFIDLAHEVKKVTAFAQEHAITIAVMGCRVNGPGETDDADLGLWCGPKYVNLKRGEEKIGRYKYNEIIPVLTQHLDKIIQSKKVSKSA